MYFKHGKFLDTKHLPSMVDKLEKQVFFLISNSEIINHPKIFNENIIPIRRVSLQKFLIESVNRLENVNKT